MPRNPRKKKKGRVTKQKLKTAPEPMMAAKKLQTRSRNGKLQKLSQNRRENQLLDLLEDAIASNHREICDS